MSQNFFTVRNPRTGESSGSFEATPRVALEKMCVDLRRAQREWEQSGVIARSGVLAEWVNKLNDSFWRDRLIQALSEDTGRRNESLTELAGFTSTLQRWISFAFENVGLWQADSIIPTSLPGFTQQSVRDAVPLVGVVSPWNFPLLLSFVDTVPALLAGSAVVIKPSEVTPRWSFVMRELIESIPALASVCGIVFGGPSTGEALVDSVDTICFTGSVQVGKKVAMRAAERFIPAHLELGGKDPALVFSDADLDSAVRSILWGSTSNAGQSCLSIERVYVQSEVYPQFIHKMELEIKGLFNLGPLLNWMAPIISLAQVPVIERHLADARARGAVVQTGGFWERGNAEGVYVMAPTLLTHVSHDMLLMNEESFAPFIPVFPFSTEDEAIEFANKSKYGLSAAVFSRNQETLKRMTHNLDVSAVSLNDCGLTAFLHQCAKTPRKDSGAGMSRMGADGLMRFFRKKAVLKKSAIDQVDPWWYPQMLGLRN